jgi:CBS domain-containing protein
MLRKSNIIDAQTVGQPAWAAAGGKAAHWGQLRRLALPPLRRLCERTGGSAMNVSAILRQKGRAVTTAGPGTTLLEVANRLAAKRIGAIVVVDTNGEVCGIVSERDIIRALAAEGAGCLTRPVAETMTKQVVTCQETDTLDELMAMMTARRFRHLPVVTDGALVGIVSIGDVVKHHIAEVEMEATAMRDYITHS